MYQHLRHCGAQFHNYITMRSEFQCYAVTDLVPSYRNSAAKTSILHQREPHGATNTISISILQRGIEIENQDDKDASKQRTFKQRKAKRADDETQPQFADDVLQMFG